MNIIIKYDVSFICKAVLQEQLEALNINFEITGMNDVEIKQRLSDEQLDTLTSNFRKYGIEIIHNPKTALVQKIKDLIVEMIWSDDNLLNITTSAYLVKKLNHTYGYLSNLFSEVTYTTIENYIILQKIERAKQMIISNNYTLTEIAFQLNYSSVAHLSNQFKKTTGLTPSSFQRIIKLRKENSSITQ